MSGIKYLLICTQHKHSLQRVGHNYSTTNTSIKLVHFTFNESKILIVNFDNCKTSNFKITLYNNKLDNF
jgi:hypothetical protein